MELLNKIWNTLEHNRYTVICPLIAILIWVIAVGCTPLTLSPLEPPRLINAQELKTEYEVWLTQNKAMEIRFAAASEDLKAQAQKQEEIKQTLLALASGSVADWPGLMQLLVSGGLLGVVGDNIRKNGVIGGLKRAAKA